MTTFGSPPPPPAPPTLVSISVTPTSSSIEEGKVQQFTAIGNYSDASTADLTNIASWFSSDIAVATISTSGLATGVLAGATNISASKDGKTSNTAALEVTLPGALDTVVITKATYNARKQKLDVEATSSGGGSVTLTATAYDSSGTVLGSGNTPMDYNAKKDKHKGTITNLTTKPFRVEVTSTGGGSDSVSGSEIGGKGG